MYDVHVLAVSRAGKAHLKRAILGQEEALRLHGVCRALRRVDLLQAVLGQALQRSLTKYSELDLEDDFFEATEAPDIQREQPGPLGRACPGRGWWAAETPPSAAVGTDASTFHTHRVLSPKKGQGAWGPPLLQSPCSVSPSLHLICAPWGAMAWETDAPRQGPPGAPPLSGGQPGPGCPRGTSVTHSAVAEPHPAVSQGPGDQGALGSVLPLLPFAVQLGRTAGQRSGPPASPG